MGLALAAAGAVVESTQAAAGLVARMVDVLCMLLESSERDGDCVAETASLLPSIAARLYMLLFADSNGAIHSAEQGMGAPLCRSQLASVLSLLTSRLLRQLVGCYELLFATALRGLCDRDSGVRKCCVGVFRLLVPLASLAKQTSAKRAKLVVADDASVISPTSEASLVQKAVSKSSELLQHIFTKQSPFRLQKSTHARDLQIMEVLSKQTNLVAAESSGAAAHKAVTLSSAQLRDYQWDGVSWLTQLRRFGLNGILADEM